MEIHLVSAPAQRAFVMIAPLRHFSTVQVRVFRRILGDKRQLRAADEILNVHFGGTYLILVPG